MKNNNLWLSFFKGSLIHQTDQRTSLRNLSWYTKISNISNIKFWYRILLIWRVVRKSLFTMIFERRQERVQQDTTPQMQIP